MTYARYLDAEHKINEGLIRLDQSLENSPRHDPYAKREEMRRFLASCGNPQAGIPAVHVTGTSGKGSVCAAVAGILQEAGLRVGLHVSPYLQSATEKLVVDGALASSDEFAQLVDWVMPLAEKRLSPSTPASIHGMASVAIAFEHFRRHKVDVIVCEVGCGGRFDLTSYLDTVVAVVTNIGLDHMATLGGDIESIAWHKAGIVRPGAMTVCGAVTEARAIVRQEARMQGSLFVEVESSGDAWSHNHALAAVAARRAAQSLQRDIDEAVIARGIGRIRLPGRSELVGRGKPRVILDGAHNAEKLKVAVTRARQLSGEGPLVVVLGLLGSKASRETLAPLTSQCSAVVVTEPLVYGKPAFPAPSCAALCIEVGLLAEIERNPFAALKRAQEIAGDKGTVLVTGSFYLVGQLREHFFPKRAVVDQCTSFPEVG